MNFKKEVKGEIINKDEFSFETENFIKDPLVFVIFGGAGDLSKRKLIPALYRLYYNDRLDCKFKIIGTGIPELNNNRYRNLINESIKSFDDDIYDKNAVNKFKDNFEFLKLKFEISQDYQNLKNKIIDTAQNMKVKKPNIIYYLASPPQYSIDIINNLGNYDMQKIFNSRIVMEKPFGYGLESAQKLNKKVLEVFNERQIYRIDHYLGKETVQNILFFRFGNSIFEPLWNRSQIDHIQITAAEEIGIGSRGKFYEENGVIRDIVQNHIMQLIALVTMEPPRVFEAEEIRNEKVKLIKSIVPTFMAGKFAINNWRWSGVPIYVRAGKRLNKKLTEIYIEFKKPPLKLFANKCNDINANGLLFSLQPEEKTSLKLNVKLPGIGNTPYSVDMSFNYHEVFETGFLPAYERLLIDCMKGDLTLFARKDGIEAMWENVGPLLDLTKDIAPDEFPNYKAGSWGPKGSKNLINRDNRKWRLRDE